MMQVAHASQKTHAHGNHDDGALSLIATCLSYDFMPKRDKLCLK